MLGPDCYIAYEQQMHILALHDFRYYISLVPNKQVQAYL